MYYLDHSVLLAVPNSFHSDSDGPIKFTSLCFVVISSSSACESTSLLTSPLAGELSGSELIPEDGLERLIDTGDDEEWCTAEDIGSNSFFQFNFTQPIFLAYMRVRGYSRSLPISTSTFVQQFALEVGDENGNFTSYGTVRKDRWIVWGAVLVASLDNKVGNGTSETWEVNLMKLFQYRNQTHWIWASPCTSIF